MSACKHKSFMPTTSYIKLKTKMWEILSEYDRSGLIIQRIQSEKEIMLLEKWEKNLKRWFMFSNKLRNKFSKIFFTF